MPNDTIIQYYRLCALTKSNIHDVNSLTQDELTTLFTKKEVASFFRKRNDKLIINESVIGAYENQKVIII